MNLIHLTWLLAMIATVFCNAAAFADNPVADNPVTDNYAHPSSIEPTYTNYVHVEGRSAIDGKSMRFAFPGAKLSVIAVGKKVSLVGTASSNMIQLDVVVDGKVLDPIKLPHGRFSIDLFELEEGKRSVEIYKRTEGWQGVLQIDQIVTDGHFEAVGEAPKRKLLFIGDSITAGTGTDAKLGDKNNGNETTNGRLAYGRVLADRLEAQCHLIAYGGRGLIRDWEGKTDTGTAPQFYERVLSDDPKQKWDATRYVPDGVSICLGTNDHNQSIIPTDQYVAAYVRFVRKIRSDFPDVQIFLLTSPMYGETPRRVELNKAIDQTIIKLDDSKVTKIDIGYYPGRPGVDSHPIASEHIKIADELEPVFRRELGW